MTHPARFSVADPLPLGRTTLIEASAGTGKTWTLAAVTVRLVAEHDVPIGRILLVTFTRAATAELRARIRARLAEAEQHLRAGAPATDDPLLVGLANVDDAGRVVRADRLAQAVRDFDTATISTIHGFCAQVRSLMGLLSPENVDAVPSESESDLVAQVCADLVFRELAADVAAVDAVKLAALVTKARTLTECVVQAESGQPADRHTAELVREAVDEVDARLRATGGVSFTSLVTSVGRAVQDPDLVATLRQQYSVALVDEFQDTDPVQWDIFRTVFGEPDSGCTLLLVGDPKQAVYAFRGGDVYTYLQAKDHARTLVLGTNQRSDPAVLKAMNALGAGEVYGEPDIAYQPVEVAERHARRELRRPDGTVAPGLVVRGLTDVDDGDKPPNAQRARRRVAADLADVAADLFGSEVHDDDGSRAIGWGDMAVLVGATSTAVPVAEALRRRRIPVVLRLRDSVANSEARDQWRTLLYALDRPAGITRATAAALTWFFHWDPRDVAEATQAALRGDDPQGLAARLVRLQQELQQWSDLLRDKGMPALLREAERTHDMLPWLLSRERGERYVTDLEHIAELVHAEARNRGTGLTAASALALVDGLGRSTEEEVAADAVQRRVESDAQAVQVMTVHGAKGLEFPVVFLPFMAAGGKRVTAERPFSFHDVTAHERVLDVSSAGPPAEGRKTVRTAQVMAPNASGQARRQNCGDQHRLTYVALTRAEHQTGTWWWPGTSGGKLSGLTRFLFGAGDSPADQPVEPSDDTPWLDQIRSRAAAAGDAVVVTEVPAASGTAPVAPGATDAGEVLAVSELGRELPRDARAWSFTGLTRRLGDGPGAHAADPLGRVEPTTGDPTVPAGDDRGALDEPSATAASPPVTGGATDGPGWDGLPAFEGLGGGKGFGNLVHAVIEHLDFTAADPVTEVDRVLAGPLGYPVSPVQRGGLAAAVAGVLATPLGPGFGGLRLGDLGRGDRLDELRFAFPLAPDSPLTARRIGEVVASHLDPADPVRSWADRLAAGLGSLRLQGFLNGSIDLVLRTTAHGGTRYSVVDYKTNDLGVRGGPRTLAPYRPDRLVAPMSHSHYVLQALVYSVALHRYLRWRVPGYAPATHLGPVGYLFVRGMVGASTPTDAEGGPAGVFTWAVPPGLVSDLSDLLAGHEVAS